MKLDKRTEAKISILDDVKAMIKNHIMDVEHSTNRDNYSSMKERKMGMQIILCAVADMQFDLRKEVDNEIL